MRALSRIMPVGWTLVICLTISVSSIAAQETKKEPSGSIAGRVTLGGKPAARVNVMLSPSERGPLPQQPPPARTTTDDDGRFRLTAVPAGSFTIVPFTPALVANTDTSFGQQGETVTLADGEEVEGIDFSLTKGGVITGRVTDAEGRPLIEQRLNLMRIDERGQRTPGSDFNPFMFGTDDRGVYRLYGLAAGRYKVSVGDAPGSGMVRIGFGGGTYARTFHPDVTEEARATIIEVTAGGEATGIDIKLGRASKTYVATGRVIDADTGKPLADLQFGHGAITGDQRSISSFGFTANRTNSDGEFRIEGLSSGRFAAFVIATEQVDFYSEPAVFEVNEADVSGLQIKVRRGSSITGLAVIEGSDDADVLAKLSKLELRAFVRGDGLTPPTMAPIRIGPDGSFRITGLVPGKVRIIIGGYPPAKGFSLLRVERDGTEQRDGIEVSAGESVSGVRLVIGYGTCVVRGQVKVEGGQITPDIRLRISARKLDTQGWTTSTVADARGRFSLEGLLPGEYELSLNTISVMPSGPGVPPPPGRMPNRPPVKQNVTVASGVETEVTLVIDLGAKDKDGEK